MSPPAAAYGGPDWKRFTSHVGEHVLVVPFSRVYDLSADAARNFDAGSPDARAAVAALAAPAEGEVALDIVEEPPVQSLSLNVSVHCNLSCGYCYAGRGNFGGRQGAAMSWEVAKAAVDRLLAGADATRPITVGFLGGEPFVNRPLLHRIVRYAADAAGAGGLDVRFSVTTNGTLLRPEDHALLRAHRFAVTVSIDGAAELHDVQRPLHRAGGSSLADLIRGCAGLLAEPGRAQVAARATVTHGVVDLRERFEAILAMGFPEVGFSPLRRAAPGAGAFLDEDWPRYTRAMIALARGELAQARRSGRIRLSNLAVALKQIYRGASSPYPCGAGGGYVSVASDGRWYACHRAVGDPEFELGGNDGLDADARRRFLAGRHVHAQPGCRGCWARYLCSGGCHQEEAARTAASCDHVRDWLEFCLSAYCDATGLSHAPDEAPPPTGELAP